MENKEGVAQLLFARSAGQRADECRLVAQMLKSKGLELFILEGLIKTGNDKRTELFEGHQLSNNGHEADAIVELQ